MKFLSKIRAWWYKLRGIEICNYCSQELDTNNNQEVESGYCEKCLGDMQ